MHHFRTTSYFIVLIQFFLNCLHYTVSVILCTTNKTPNIRNITSFYYPYENEIIFIAFVQREDFRSIRVLPFEQYQDYNCRSKLSAKWEYININFTLILRKINPTWSTEKVYSSVHNL